MSTSLDWRVEIKYRDMIRDRSISTYEEMLGFPIRAYAEAKVKNKGSFKWVDLCCGQFAAGQDLTYNLFQNGKKEIVDGIEAIGVDAVTFMGDDIHRVGFNATVHKRNVVDYVLPEGVDLVTCLLGLRYVEQYLKQGALAVQNWYNQLPIGGILLLETPFNQRFLAPGERPIMVGDRKLPIALHQRLGKAVKIYSTYHHGYHSSIVKITKKEIAPLNLF